MVYVFSSDPFVTVMITVFSPSSQVAAELFVCGSPFTVIAIPAFSSVDVAVIVFVVFAVVAAYSKTPESKAGVKESVPIVSPDKDASTPPLENLRRSLLLLVTPKVVTL